MLLKSIMHSTQSSELFGTHIYEKNNNIDNSDDETNIDEIKQKFENYNEDVSFGGTKQLIKIYINPHHEENSKRSDYLINIDYIYDKQLEQYDLCISDINDRTFSHIKKIIDKKIIQNNNVYDLNDISFQKKINKYKKIYNNVTFSKKVTEKINNDQKRFHSYSNLKKIQSNIYSKLIV